MIITCPSCSTRYRSPDRTGESVFQCSCSRCEAVFSSDEGMAAGPVPPVLAVQASLQPQSASAGQATNQAASLADFPIGMDDPTLEAKIRPSTPDGYEPPPVDLPDFGLPEDPDEVFEETVAECRAESAPAAESPAEGTARTGRTGPGVLALLVVVLLPAALAGGAWQLSQMVGQDPMTWIAPAGVLGLLFAWLWVRWKYRER